MTWKKILSIFASSFLIFTSGCNLPETIPVIGGNNEDPVIAAQTQVAIIVASTYAAQTALAFSVNSTLQALATFTPVNTSTPSLTPTATFTVTPTVPMVSVSVQTNCRSGPGTAYDKIGIVNVGQTAEVVGRSMYNDYWIIKLPSNPAITCWLWGQYATVVGNISGLPSINPPPTPTPKATLTPAPNFTVSFIDNTFCAPQHAFQFQVDNTGQITWESIRIIITDNTTSTTTTHTLDSFRSYEACTLESNQLNLEPGEGGHVANINPGQLAYDPSGHHFTAVFSLCSLDGLAGTCMDKTITFNP
jgi:hypothetical protein